MSEIDKHYGGDAEATERTRAAARRRAPAESPDEPGHLDRAAEALKDAREAASHTAERVRETVSDGYDRAHDWAEERYDSLSRNAVYARRRSVAEFNRGRRGVASFVEENPIMVGVAGLAAGLLIGALLPATRRENRYLGPYADDMRREGVRYARDVAQQGREAISENLRAIADPKDRDRG